jgi:hypothetical protein
MGPSQPHCVDWPGEVRGGGYLVAFALDRRHEERVRPRDAAWGAATSPLPKQRCGYLFLTAKIPEPLVWVAIAVWSQLEELLVPASQPDVFGPFGRNWSSL